MADDLGVECSHFKKDMFKQQCWLYNPHFSFAVGSLMRVWSVAQLCPTFCNPHGLQLTRLLCPWDFPGENTGVGCHFFFQGILLTEFPVSPALAGGFFTTEPPRKPSSQEDTPIGLLGGYFEAQKEETGWKHVWQYDMGRWTGRIKGTRHSYRSSLLIFCLNTGHSKYLTGLIWSNPQICDPC